MPKIDHSNIPQTRLTWWFDHHQSAFLTPEDAAHFHNDHSGKKMYRPDLSLLHRLYIATVAAEKFGFEAPDLSELIKWADIVDGAQYANAKDAVDLVAPAMRLTLVIEGSQGSGTVQKIIRYDAASIA